MSLTKVAIEKLGVIQAMVLCNKLGLPEGSGEEMRQSLLKHFGFKAEKEKPTED